MRLYKTAFLLLILAFSLGAGAQRRSFWSHGLGKVLKTADDKVKSWQYVGIDTNYVQVPEKDRYVYVGSYNYMLQHDTYIPVTLQESDYPAGILPYMPSNYKEYCYTRIDMHTVQSELALGVDWRGIALELPITLHNNFSKSFGLAKNGSVWGARLRYKSLHNMKGTLDNASRQVFTGMVENLVTDIVSEDPQGENHTPITHTTSHLNRGEVDLKMFYAEGYYVLNHQKFSLSAGMYGDMIQKKSAGSMFFMANYYQNRAAMNSLMNNDRDTFRNNKVSVGAGYGYNWAMMDGRLCLHASFIPMLSLLNRVTHHGHTTFDKSDPDYDEEMDDLWKSFDNHFYDGCDMSRDSHFTFNCFARLAANYSWNRYLISLLMNYRQNIFCNSTEMSIANREFDAQVNFGFRF